MLGTVRLYTRVALAKVALEFSVVADLEDEIDVVGVLKVVVQLQYTRVL